MESDFPDDQTIGTRVVMGQETLLKSTEIQKVKPLVEPVGQTPPTPAPPLPQAQSKEENSGLKQEDEQKDPVQLSTKHFSPSHKPPSPSSSSPQPVTAEDTVMDTQEEGGTSQKEVPSLPFSELACPVTLSFSEPAFAVDPLRVGMPSSLDPDLYYTAPSTPIKMTPCSSHLKHNSYPGSPACPLSPGSPSDSEDLCSPLTSPTGSYITAEGGSWTSSYTSSTSPSTSPNPLLTEEAQEAHACFVSSLSEIGDEVGEEKGQVGPEKEEERVGDYSSHRPEDFSSNPRIGRTEAVILEEEEEAPTVDEVKVTRESCRPSWVTENRTSLRSSSSHSSDSQEDEGESECSVFPPEEANSGKIECARNMQTGLSLQLDTCLAEEVYRQIDEQPHLLSTALTPDMTMGSSSFSSDSPLTPHDVFGPGAFDRLGSGSFIFSQAASADDTPEEERMIPASLISFPLNTSLIFRADSMEITLFPTEEDYDIGEVPDGDEGKDVDAYAAGEEEADVEDGDDDDDDEDDEDDDYDDGDDGECSASGAADCDDNNENHEDIDNKEGAPVEAKVEVKVVEDVEGVVDVECGSRAVEDPRDEDSSASFLHSLSETSINEGLDESFCYQDDTDDSLDSASYNGDEDECLYSTERHAQSLEPTSNVCTPVDVPTEPEQVSKSCTNSNENIQVQLNTEKTCDPCEITSLSETAHPMENTRISEDPEDPQPCEPLSHPESESSRGIGQLEPPPLKTSSDKPSNDQNASCLFESDSHQPDISGESDGSTGGLISTSDPFTILEDSNDRHQAHHTVMPDVIPDPPNHVNKSSSFTLSQKNEDLDSSTDVTKKNTQQRNTTMKQSTDCSVETSTQELERDSFKLLIRPRHCQPESQTTVRATRLVLSKSLSTKSDVPRGAEAMYRPGMVMESELKQDQKNGRTSVESVGAESRNSGSTSSSDIAAATNDLNKGVVLLSSPKDTCPSPSNIPVSVTSDVVDNLSLTSEFFPGDCGQENLRETLQGTIEGAIGAVGSHSPVAISPKRENSETETKRRMDSRSGMRGDGRMVTGLGFSSEPVADLVGWKDGQLLENQYEMESESQNKQMTLVPSPEVITCEHYINVPDTGVQEEENYSQCEMTDRITDEKLIEKIASESILTSWKSIEEISEAGGGEDGSTEIPVDEDSYLNTGTDVDRKNTTIQDTWNNNSNDSAFESLKEMMCGTLNALSEEVRPQNVNITVKGSPSNIPLEEIQHQASDSFADQTEESLDSSVNQTSETRQTSSSKKDVCNTSASIKTSMNTVAKSQHFHCSTELHQDATTAANDSFCFPHGSFGSFTPKCKSAELRPSRRSQYKVENNDEETLESLKPETDRNQKVEITDTLTRESLGEEALGGQQCFCYNSGEDGGDETTDKKIQGDKRDKNKKMERKASPLQTSPKHMSCPGPKEGCTDKPNTAEKGRRGKQRKHRKSQKDDHGSSSSDSVDDMMKDDLSNTTAEERTKEITGVPKPETDQEAKAKTSPLGHQNSTSGTDNAEPHTEVQDHSSTRPEVSSHECLESTSQVLDNINVIVALNEEMQQKEQTLDNRPLITNRRITVDINDNNIVTDHTQIISSPHSRSSTPLPCASSEEVDDLPTPIQESQPVLSIGQQSFLSPCQDNTFCSSSQETQQPSNDTFPSCSSSIQKIPSVTPPSASFSTATTASLTQPTQESSLSVSGNNDSLRIEDSVSCLQSQSYSHPLPHPNNQSHKHKQGYTRSSQEKPRGEFRNDTTN